jgi:hypothetical protein
MVSDGPGSPDDKPAFLDPVRAKAIGYVGAPPDAVPTFDHELEPLPELPGEELPPRGKGPSSGYEERHRAIARLHAYGYTNNQIARHLGYSAPGISLALQRPWTQEEVQRVRAQMVDPDVLGKLKAAGTDAITHIHKSILDPLAKEEIRSTNARWAVEKLTGKPRQEVSVESGTLSNFMSLLLEMQSRGEVLDVTPIVENTSNPSLSAPQPDAKAKWDEWLDNNLASTTA